MPLQTSSGSNAPPFAMSEPQRLRAMAVSSVQVPGGRPIQGSSNAGNGRGIAAARWNSNGAPEGVAHGEPQDRAHRPVARASTVVA